MSRARRRHDSTYWDRATRPHRHAGPARSWRQHCDDLHRDLLDEWIADERPRRALKTDLFDEATHHGIAPQLARVAGVVHGIDVSAAVTRDAVATHPGLLCSRADVRALPFADGTFGLVVSNSTLDHFERRDDIAHALGEIHRVTADGGALVITMDNLANPVIRLRSLLPFPLLRRVHLVPYYVGSTLTGEKLVSELEATGFRVERTRTFLHAPRIVAMAACWLADALGTEGTRRAVLGILRAAEAMEAWPWRRQTAYYVAALAVRDRQAGATA